jgi:sarcosine oxidase subunit alpha
MPDVDPESTALMPLGRLRGVRGKAFVDLQNDVTDDDVALAAQEGFRAVEHLKRYTTLGMATDQGKTSNGTGLALMAEFTARTIPQTGTTTFRPPFTPVAIGALAGAHRGKDFKPTRLPPSHRWAREQSAVFVETGYWLRAQWYPRPGETDWLESVSREVCTVRSSVGLCDVSTLGKIDLQGADAAEFLERLYTNSWKTLAVGKARYGLMLREDGLVLDDGTTSRLGENRFIVTTTTANAAKVLQHMEFCHQWLWPDSTCSSPPLASNGRNIPLPARARAMSCARSSIASTTSQRGLSLHGGGRADRDGWPAGSLVPHLLLGRAGLRDRRSGRTWRRLVARPHGSGPRVRHCPYGTEALGVMRIEKGHVAGNEINGRPPRATWDWPRCCRPGRTTSARHGAAPRLVVHDRPTLAGFEPVNREDRLRAGAHFIREGAQPTARNDEGYMTSVAFSPTLGHWIGLGLLAGGPSRHGERVRAYDPVRGGDVPVEVCNPVFYDPAGERLRG